MEVVSGSLSSERRRLISLALTTAGNTLESGTAVLGSDVFCFENNKLAAVVVEVLSASISASLDFISNCLVDGPRVVVEESPVFSRTIDGAFKFSAVPEMDFLSLNPLKPSLLRVGEKQ